MDANHPKKYYLSLNPKENIYKCWYCGQSGGVLQFESLLTGCSFKEIKQKYFGSKKKKSYHPADLLSPKQLEAIDWVKIKRNHYKEYKRSLQEVIADWKAYVRQQRILAFAKLLVGIEMNQYQLLTDNIQKQGANAHIPHLLYDVTKMYLSGKWTDWAIEARMIAGIAYKTSKAEDNGLKNALFYVVLAYNEYMVKGSAKNKKMEMNKNVS